MILLEFIQWLGVCTIYGTSFIFYDYALVSFPALTVTTLRLGIASVLLVCYTAIEIRNGKMPISAVTQVLNVRDLSLFFILALANTVIPVALLCYGIFYVNSAVASIIGATTPVIFQLFRILRGESSDIPLRSLWLGILVSMSGVAMTTAEDIKNTDISDVVFVSLGNVFLILSSISYAGGAYISRYYCAGFHPYMNATIPSIMGTIFGLICFLPIDAVYPPLGTLPNLGFFRTAGIKEWFGVLYQGVFAGCIGFILYYRLVKTIGPAKVTAAWMTFPVFGVVESVLFLNNWQGKSLRYKVLQCFGSFLVILGMCIMFGGIEYLYQRLVLGGGGKGSGEEEGGQRSTGTGTERQGEDEEGGSVHKLSITAANNPMMMMAVNSSNSVLINGMLDQSQLQHSNYPPRNSDLRASTMEMHSSQFAENEL